MAGMWLPAAEAVCEVDLVWLLDSRTERVPAPDIRSDDLVVCHISI